jgi:hypothetical protein
LVSGAVFGGQAAESVSTPADVDPPEQRLDVKAGTGGATRLPECCLSIRMGGCCLAPSHARGRAFILAAHRVDRVSWESQVKHDLQELVLVEHVKALEKSTASM